MLNYKVEILKEAYRDLNEYTDYIERMTFSKDKADEESSKILGEILKLNFMPHMYPKTYKEFHVLIYNNKRIFYKIYEKKKKVVIVKILGQSQDYENII